MYILDSKVSGKLISFFISSAVLLLFPDLPLFSNHPSFFLHLLLIPPTSPSFPPSSSAPQPSLSINPSFGATPTLSPQTHANLINLSIFKFRRHASIKRFLHTRKLAEPHHPRRPLIRTPAKLRRVPLRTNVSQRTVRVTNTTTIARRRAEDIEGDAEDLGLVFESTFGAVATFASKGAAKRCAGDAGGGDADAVYAFGVWALSRLSGRNVMRYVWGGG